MRTGTCATCGQRGVELTEARHKPGHFVCVDRESCFAHWQADRDPDASPVILWSSSRDRYEVWFRGRELANAASLGRCMDHYPDAVLAGNGPDGQPIAWAATPPRRSS